MDGASLDVALEPDPAGSGRAGRETVELRVATNPGMPVAPLGDAASGGELSRVMLALAGARPCRERGDAGLRRDRRGRRRQGRAAGRASACDGSGRGGSSSASPIYAQVASLAARHFRVEKAASGKASVARVEAVSGDEQLAEIVRMLGAERDDEAALGHAKELLAA